MTPKQKADELYEKYHYQICNDNGLSEDDCNIFCAKQCALIAVEEILKACPVISLVDSANNYIYDREYWEQVKQEIKAGGRG